MSDVATPVAPLEPEGSQSEQPGTARGRQERAEIPRSTHSRWEPPGGRRDPVEVLEEQATSRVPELVPIRYGRMMTSAFAFYRGAAAIMAEDLSGIPRTSLHVQVCGDAHLSNFGVFAAPDRNLVFSVNDFDETLPGPFEWDVKRLVASFAVGGRERGFDSLTRAGIILAAAREYRTAMRAFAAMPLLDVWYASLDVAGVSSRWGKHATGEQAAQFKRNIAKARAKDSHRAVAKLTESVDGERRIVGSPPLIVPVEDLMQDGGKMLGERFGEIMSSYLSTLPNDRRALLARYRYVHAARKVVGVGSVGTRAWILLMLESGGENPLMLQFKEAQPSVLEPFISTSVYANHGQRVVEGQRLMQATSDIMLGWMRTEGIDGITRDFYVRQLWDGKGSIDFETARPRQARTYAEMCGWTLARAHARSGDRAAMAAYLGGGTAFDVAMVAFAEAYADQNDRDFAAIKDAAASGRISVEAGL